MKTKKNWQFNTTLGDYKGLSSHIKRMLKEGGVNERATTETMLVFEAAYNDMLGQGLSEETEISVWGLKMFGDFRIKMGFEGSVYAPLSGERVGSVDSIVMKSYADRIDHRYHTGFNTIILIARRSYHRTLTFCIAAMLIALIEYLVFRNTTGIDTQHFLLNEIVLPMEKLFTNAMLMVAAPVTFFSLLKNLTDSYIVAERSSGMRALQRKILVSSLCSVILALLTAQVWIAIFSAIRGSADARTIGMHMSFSEIIGSLMPSSIFEPFETVSPFPLIMLAGLTTYAFCSVGQFFDRMKDVIHAAYTVFSNMLSAVMFSLPLFCFLAVLDILLSEGIGALIKSFLLVFPAIISLSVLAVYYAIRLRRNGINVIGFAKKLPGLLAENYKINSAINAVPFNVRYCTINYGMDKSKLEEALPVLAQINLDGNCFMICLVALMYMNVTGIRPTWFEVLSIAVLVLFLSLGAPNQPGSSIIGLLIISNYLNAADMLPLAIYSEILFGGLLNLINVTGDIITAAISGIIPTKVEKQDNHLLKENTV